jgi:hypothetical protein
MHVYMCLRFSYEGCKAHAYLCTVTVEKNGVWTNLLQNIAITQKLEMKSLIGS